jgi:hypothetical protein
MTSGEPDTRLAVIASDALSLAALQPTEEELALVGLLHGILGPRLALLAACDVTKLAAEPNLDPGRAPREP